jgi:RNA polymerase sigma-70 factor, ECF subfamily
MPGIARQIALQELPLAHEERATTRDNEFTALVWRQSRFVFRVAYSILRNVQDSDDVVQETFLKLYRSRAWERMADEKAFLARVAWRIAVSQLRKAPTNPLGAETASTAQSPEHAAIVSDWSTAVCRLIDALPEELRQPLALSSIEELNSREIAKVMGIPEGTVRTRLARARQILKQKLSALRVGPNEKRRP